MQLVAIGAQDVHLTGEPQISFFKVVYRRHTNFSMESIEQSFNGTAKPGSRVTCTISRNGDLVTNMWLEVDMGTNKEHFVNSVGHALIEYVELEIGGQRIDKHYGEWLEIWSELTLPEEKRHGFKEMIGRRDAYNDKSKLESRELFIPLQFFFCRNPGLALPLIALQYHEVKLNIKFRDGKKLDTNGDISGKDVKDFDSVKLYVDYVYLDTEERQRFAQMSHEYLIEQLQHTGAESTKSDQVRLNFNHPVKELVWAIRSSGANVLEFGSSELIYGTANVDDSPFATADSDRFDTAKLQLNGHDRFTERKAAYFRLVQPYQHHTRVPNKHIYCYSFALNPEAHQPSGTCNFSRLDNVTLNLKGLSDKSDEGELLVYAVSNNILRITSGMGGLAYSN